MKPKVLFIGCVDFSRGLLERTLQNNQVSICGIITKKASPFNSDHCDLSTVVEGLGIPVFFTEKGVEEDILSCIEELKPQAIYCFGWSHLLSSSVLSATPLGCVGYHPALLPFNRGRHPIIWALALGLTETGSTFFRADEGADTGDILSQRTVSILDEDDALSLYEKLKKVALEQIEEIDTMVVCGALQGMPQRQDVGSSWRKRSKADGHIDFRMPSFGIRNLVKALRPPYPGAHVVYNANEYTVGTADVSHHTFENMKCAEPGKILHIQGERISVKSGDGAVVLLEHNLPKTIKKGEYFL